MTRQRTTRRGARSLVLVTVLAFAAAAVPPTPAGAQAEALGSYSGVAAADGARLGLVVPDTTVVEEIIDVGSTLAQAAVDSLGTTTGLAAAPWPGSLLIENAAALTGLVGLPPLPSYPLLARSDAVAPEERIEQPGIVLEALSGDASASARARTGQGDSTSSFGVIEAVADVGLSEDGSVITAQASSTVEGLRLGSLLTIAGVTSTASASLQAGADEVEIDHELSIDVVRILGLPVGLTQNGLVLLGQILPLPIDVVLDALSDQGVDIRFLEPRVTEGGVTSAGLEVTFVSSSANERVPEATVSVVFGRSTVRVSASSFPAPSTPPVVPAAPAPPVTAPEVLDDAGSIFQPGTGTLDPPAPTATPSVQPPATGQAAPQVVTTTPAAAGALVEMSSVYLLLVIGAVVIVVLVQLVRFLGVRLLWS